MSQKPDLNGRSVVTQPDHGPSYWQPVSANGYAEVMVSPAITGFEDFSMGYQTIDPGCLVREHAHQSEIELQVCFRGAGRIVVDGASHDLVPGTTCLLGHNVKHAIYNESDEDLVMLWVITPPGLEDRLAAKGRPRRAGEPAPEPFARQGEPMPDDDRVRAAALVKARAR